LFGLLAYTMKDIGVHHLGDAIVLWGITLLSLALLIFGFWFIIGSLIALMLIRQQIYLFERGLVTLGAGKVRSYPWSQVKAVWREVTHHYKTTGSRTTYEGTEYRYKLQLSDGRKLRLDTTTQDVHTLGEKIVQAVGDILWVESMAVLKAGGSVDFGSLALSEQGILRRRGGKADEILPWSEVDTFRIGNARLRMTKNGRFWWSASVAHIPNVNLFLALSNRMLASYGNALSIAPEDAIYVRLRATGERPY
ncbi:MAG: hypothetical protein J2P36_22050, partial [Ktedonobacteraceae bacterium]|nr:hypothetical protein [Ktedonobacteraceae bacterium]